MANLEWASDLALKMIGKYGASIRVTVQKPNSDSDEPWKPTEPTEVSRPVKGLFTRFEQKYIDGTLVKQEDRRVLVAGLELRDLDPEVRISGQISMGSHVWQIISINQVAPDENTALYIFQVRK